MNAMNMNKFLLRSLSLLLFIPSLLAGQQVTPRHLDNTKIDGYRSIWFELGPSTEYGVKYSGGFGTYTMKHSPLAIYAPAVNKTFFVYGGTPSAKDRYLVCMAGCFDHTTGMVCKPTVVCDKQGVNDPHDNPSILLDDKGYVWVYVSGRANRRPGIRYRSTEPYSIERFEEMNRSVMAYPNPRYVPGKGHFLFFTRYDGVRRIYYQTSPDGMDWSPYRPLASIMLPGDTRSGHYQIIGEDGTTVASAFNRHLEGRCDYRMNIYYVQTADFGQTWTTADGTRIEPPVTTFDDPSLVLNTEKDSVNVYIKDLRFDRDGHPVILYVSGKGYRPGPREGLREWHVAHFNGKKWVFRFITTSTHNYDSGSLFIEDDLWRVIAPTDDGAFHWYAGGEVVSWVSRNQGKKWVREHTYTHDSPGNHGYVRRVLDGRDPFYCLWSDSIPNKLSACKLYFADSKGNVWELPYEMTADWEYPKKMY